MHMTQCWCKLWPPIKSERCFLGHRNIGHRDPVLLYLVIYRSLPLCCDWSAFLRGHDQITEKADIRRPWDQCPVIGRCKAILEEDTDSASANGYREIRLVLHGVMIADHYAQYILCFVILTMGLYLSRYPSKRIIKARFGCYRIYARSVVEGLGLIAKRMQ